MTGLLADGWFYISSAGLLVSGVLFFFLLGQYRAATDAADQPEPEAAAEPHAPLVRPVWISDAPAASAKVASVPADKPAVQPVPSEPAPAPAEKRRETTTGGVNPAVVYLQNIKSQLEEIHNENRDLAKRVEAITSRDEALIERLAELAQAVAELKGANAAASAPAPVPAPAPAEPASKRVKKNGAPPPPWIEPTTSAGVPERKSAPKTEPTAETLFSPDETERMALKPAVAAPAPAEPAPAPEAAEEPAPGEKPRRGPVWPV